VRASCNTRDVTSAEARTPISTADPR